MQTQRVLIVTDIPFWHRQKGSQNRIAALVDHLAAFFSVSVVFLGAEKPPAVYGSADVTHMVRHEGPGLLAWKVFGCLPARLQQAIVGVLNRFHYRRSLDSFRSEKLLSAFAAYLDREYFDAVIIEYIWHAYLTDAVDSARSMLLLDTHDIFHRRVADFARFGRTPDKVVTREQELAVYRRFDRLIAIQAVEQAYLEDILPGRAILAMHPVPARPGYYEQRLRTATPGGRLVIVYFAAYSDVNRDAIDWFVSEVWDQDLAEHFELCVHGSICETLRISAPGVRVVGRSKDAETVYRNADIAINPQRFGSGLKIKTIEAMGFGVPVVTTSIGSEGLEEIR
ncbi:MAG: glycosyltransferase family 4 protein, partial [Pseudomonadales bacterium]|nr:glycosyltransferase family 4 protein [Pseudomonadales bacterium]